MSKSELKRKCVMNPLDMAEEIDRLARLCEAKDAEIERWVDTQSATHNLYELAKKQLSEANALYYKAAKERDEAQEQISMQAEALSTCINHDDGFSHYQTFNKSKVADALSASAESVAAWAESVAAWEAEKLEPLRRQVAMLHKAALSAREAILLRVGADYDDVIHAAYLLCKDAVDDTQATAEALLNEYAEKVRNEVLFEVTEELYGYKNQISDEIFIDTAVELVENLRAQSAQKKGE